MTFAVVEEEVTKKQTKKSNSACFLNVLGGRACVKNMKILQTLSKHRPLMTAALLDRISHQTLRTTMEDPTGVAVVAASSNLRMGAWRPTAEQGLQGGWRTPQT